MYLSYLFAIGMAFLSLGCFESKDYRELDEITRSGQITILTRNSSTTFFKNKDGQMAGFEYELSKLYADHLGLKLNIISLPTLEAVLTGIEEGRGDIAAAGLTITPERLKRLNASSPYNTIRQNLICHPRFQGESIKDVVGKDLVVLAGSSYEERLNELKEKMPELSWSKVSDLSSDQIMQLIWEGGPDCSIIDSNIVNVHRRFMPELKVIGDVSGDQHLGWYINKKNKKLLNSVNQWLSLVDTKASLERLETRYYGESKQGALFKLNALKKRIKTHLKKYKKLFQASAERYNFPWKLIAAISYQQSRWEEDAYDPRGGVGLMLITPEEAQRYGVSNKSDPGTNLTAGVKRLSQIYEGLPPFILKEDRLWMAVAGFNIGINHLQDARKIAVETNFNPNTWDGVKKVLPLLSHKNYYKNLRHGFAQGVEPVLFVQRVQLFYNELNRQKGL